MKNWGKREGGGAARVLATGLAMLAVACGGSEDDAAGAADVAGVVDVAQAAGVMPVAPLLADDGSVMPSAPQAEPADPGARTQSGRYADAASAEQMQHGRHQGLLAVRVDGSGAAAVEAAVQAALETRAARGLERDAPVLVAGTDLRSAAVVVDRLEAAGLARVWLVTR